MEENKRKAISNKVRFEVFKRDSFRCQYCGKSSPDVVLEVDHIQPVSKGGTNDMLNLVTSCWECNSGKSNRLLSDDAEVEKQKRMLDELNERRLQLEMMMDWRNGLSEIDETKVEIAHEQWKDSTLYSLNDAGLKVLRKLVKKYDFNILLDCMEAATEQYLRYEKGKVTQDSAEKAWIMIERIIKNKMNPMPDHMKELYYARGILRQRLSYVDDVKAIRILKAAHEFGYTTEELKNFCLDVKNWTEFRRYFEEKGVEW